jgi:hypothetical protein
MPANKSLSQHQLRVLVELYDSRILGGVRFDTCRRLVELGLCTRVSLVDGRIEITALGDRAVRLAQKAAANA